MFDTRTTPMIVAVGNDGQFARFCAVAGLDELSIDERYATNPERVARRGDAVRACIAARLGERTCSQWLAALEAVGVPCGPVNNLAEVFTDPHVVARGAEVRMPCGWAQDGEIPVLANPLRMSATPPTYRRVSPRLDEHHSEVLADWLRGNRPSSDEEGD